jgi:hypothetical protein
MASTAQFKSFGPFYYTGALVGAPRIWHYLAGTSTLKDAYTDRGKLVTAAQPLVGDANGVASAFFDGLYKIVVKTSDGITLFTWDNVLITEAENQETWVSVVGGTANAITLTPAVPITAYVAGLVVNFVAVESNTGAATAQMSGLTAQTIQKSGPSGNTILYAGDIPQGGAVRLIHDGTNFNLAPVSAPAEVNWTPSLGGSTTYTSQDGFAYKSGILVHLNVHLAVNVMGSGSPREISGAPYVAYGPATAPVKFSGSATSVDSVLAHIADNTSVIKLYSAAAPTGTLGQNDIFTSLTAVEFGLSYLTRG